MIDVNINGCKIKVNERAEINSSRWNNECWLNIACSDRQDKEHKCYVDREGLEYEIELFKKPPINKIRLHLDFPQGLTFHLQRELTQEEIGWGFERPENVIDSIAVYWKKRNNKYKRGKFCHIYRIRAIDANGHWVWCKQDIIGKVWVITIDQDFLNSAAYPIIIDPYIGYSTPGASNMSTGNFLKGSCDITNGDGGNITKFHCAISSKWGATPGIKIGVCNTSDGNPSGQTTIEQVEFDAEVSDDFEIAAPEGNQLDPDTIFYIPWTGEHLQNRIKFDFVAELDYYHHSVVNYAGQIQSPLPPNFSYVADINVSIWIDYELPPPVSDPVFDPIEGEYIESVDITIICETEGSTIKYTTDGSTPTPTHGTEYTVPVTIGVGITTLKAMAYKAGMWDSGVVSGVYTVVKAWREIIEIDSPITKEIEFDSPITKEINFDSRITREIEFDSEVNNG